MPAHKSAQLRDLVHELWGLGFTVARRHPDPFYIPDHAIPRGMRYEWANKSDLAQRLKDGWKIVPFQRHDGLLAPYGMRGDAQVQGMTLLELPQTRSNEEAKRIAGAEDNVRKWMEDSGGAGLSGGVRVWTGDPKPPAAPFRTVGDPVMARRIIDGPIPVLPPPRPSIWQRIRDFFTR